MITVVADTSPINYLVRIREIEVLHGLFGEILLPPAVHTELQHHTAPDEVRAWAANLPTWARVVRPSRIDASIGLGKGETEAISLAKEINADVLLIDERRGRMAATVRGVHAVGTILVIGMAHEKRAFEF